MRWYTHLHLLPPSVLLINAGAIFHNRRLALPSRLRHTDTRRQPMNTLTSVKPVTRTRPFIRRILVAVDLTARCLGTAEYAVNIAKSFGASVVFVYVHPTETMLNFITRGGYDLVDAKQRDQRYALISLTDTVSKKYPFCSQTFLVGEPAETVAAFAREIEADVIIVGSHHPSLVTKLLHLDQAPRMVRLASCPVLVYHDESGEKCPG